MQVMGIAWLALMGVAAGASVVVQQVLIANLRGTIGSPLWAALISYIGGTLAMIALILINREKWPAAEMIGSGPWLPWISGVFGVFYIVIAISLMPKLGAATVLALLVAGQMLASILFDHFGIMGLPQHSADLTRVIGGLLLVGGVVLIRL